MNIKTKLLLKNLNYTVTANLIAFFVSALLSIVVPKFIGINTYSFWQLYVFYSSYVSFFQLGWLEGIYLKIGGEEYQDLDKNNLGSQFWYFLFFQLIAGTIILFYSLFFVDSSNKRFILVIVSMVMVVSNVKLFCLYILQSTNRIREYAKLARNDRYLYFILVSIYLFFGGRSFRFLVFFDLLSKIIITLWGIYCIKDLIFVKVEKLKILFREILDNIKIGSNLMLASIANLLILGTTRFFVEKKWSIEVFGSLSFALSISNMFMLLTNSVGTVLYPMLRRAKVSELPIIYKEVRTLFIPVVFGLLLLYYPARIILTWWLPDYEVSLFYIGILFPMIVYEGRVSLLTNTYLKTLRKERIILLVNSLTWFLSIVLSLFSVFYYNNIDLTVIVIIISLFFRCILSEEILVRILDIHIGNSNMIESFLTIFFVSSNFFLSTIQSGILYLIVYLIYLLMNKKKIVLSIRFFKMISSDKFQV